MTHGARAPFDRMPLSGVHRTLYADGGVRGQGKVKGDLLPGRIAVYDEELATVVIAESTPPTTNNEAEYLAILKAIWYAREVLNVRGVLIYTDSELVQRQVCNVYETRDMRLRTHMLDVRIGIHAVDGCLLWTARETNPAGHYLETMP